MTDSETEDTIKNFRDHPDDHEIVKEYGRNSRKCKEEAAAIKCLTSFLEKDPPKKQIIPAMKELGLCYSSLKKEINALEWFDKILEKEPENFEALYSKGKSCLNIKNYKYAIDLFENALKQKPDDFHAIHTYIDLGEAYDGLEKRFDAISCLKNAQELITELENKGSLNDTSDHWNTLGVCCSKMGHEEEALEIFENVLINDPENEKALNSKGYSLSKLGKDREAIKVFDKILKLNSSNIAALNSKGISQCKIGEENEALDSFKKILESNDSDIKAYKNIVKLKIKFGRYDKAHLTCQNALNIEPNDPWFLTKNGLALAHLNRFEDAEEQFDTALLIDPKFQAAHMGKGLMMGRKKVYIAEIDYQMKLLTGITNTIERTQQNLSELSDNIKQGLNLVNTLFYFQFTFGCIFLFSAVGLKLLGYGDITSILSALGGSTFLISSIFTSPMRIQKNRIDYSQWMITYSNWINAHFTINRLLLENAKAGDSSTEKKKVDWDSIQPFLKYLDELTNNTIDTMETKCEFPYSPNEPTLKEDAKKI